MLNRELLENQLAEFPLFTYGFIAPTELDFTERVRYICSTECPMHGKTWACPPAVGEVDACKAKGLSYENCLLIGTITECKDISDIDETLSTRGPHEEITDLVADLMRREGEKPYVLSTEACAKCAKCAYLEGKPCIHPDKMHPCVESHGINVIPVLEGLGLEFQYGSNIITWYSLLFF